MHKAAVSCLAQSAQKNKAGSSPTLQQCRCLGDCKSLCRVDLLVKMLAQGCCQLLWHSSTEEQDRQFTLNPAAVHLCMVTASLCAEWIFICVNAVTQGCCQLVWHSSTEEQGRQFTLNPAAVHWCLGCNCRVLYCSVTQGCCQLFGTAAQKNKAGSSP